MGNMLVRSICAFSGVWPRLGGAWWWRMVEATHTVMAEHVVREAFKKPFRKKVTLDHIWVQKLTEFEQLIQGAIIVQHYEIHFNELSRFAVALIAILQRKGLDDLLGVSKLVFAMTSWPSSSQDMRRT